MKEVQCKQVYVIPVKESLKKPLRRIEELKIEES